jgi:hypothetical protein
LATLGKLRLDQAAIEETLGCISKSVEDDLKVRGAGLEKLLAQATERT